MEYKDFGIKLERSGAGRYCVRLLSSLAGEACEQVRLPAGVNTFGSLRLDFLRALWETGDVSVNRDLTPGGGARSKGLTPRQLGDALFNLIFAGSIRACLDESRGRVLSLSDCGLRIKVHLDLSEPDIAQFCSVPWEMLFRPETRDFLALSRSSSIVRYLDLPRQPCLTDFKLPLRIGVLAAGPQDLPALRLAEEVRRIESAWRARSAVDVVLLNRRGFGSLRQQLLEGRFHVLHFMGHGSFERATGEGVLFFEDDYGNAEPVSGEALASMIKDVSTIRLVVLNACQTAMIAPGGGSDPLIGLSSALMLAGAPSVISMQCPISDGAAIEFSAALYSHLANGECLDVAVTEGRLAVYAANPRSFEWATPVVFLRASDGKLFSERGHATVEEETKEGVGHLSRHDFVLAGECFRRALLANPENPIAKTYMALCSLSGRAIYSLPEAEAGELNDSLVEVIECGDEGVVDLAMLLLGLLRYDFYRPRGLEPSSVPSSFIYRYLEGRYPSLTFKKWLRSIHSSRSARLLFRIDT